ncbi:uncharacterized protein [Spinacia oleracea]|uniref:Uncharacterized protein isoform X2 n=1 Tax=Spinacia oleracea TaxID=3562 RepID=A0ABM3R107_SPIOL|nr:uncharacterized protein LOC110805352 isoform X2 [Spinacia oleracea]
MKPNDSLLIFGSSNAEVVHVKIIKLALRLAYINLNGFSLLSQRKSTLCTGYQFRVRVALFWQSALFLGQGSMWFITTSPEHELRLHHKNPPAFSGSPGILQH